ncbi:protein PHYTOCHROME KINASE SUBSTRATE 1-like [Typha angustifolia]|uniref:protein PHYTOCHROME KINASE SUBSTRATE 1-like n=1 Tax=Typha angustifolia TaxID=59011 RepID=UPI003C2C0B06
MASLTNSSSLDTNPGPLRNDSFSSYLNLVRQSFQFELERSGPHRSPSRRTNLSLNRRRSDDGELDIFDAEKYFSGGMDGAIELAAVRGLKKPTKREAKGSMKSKPMRSRYSSSEASCNSQSTLLRDHRRYPRATDTRGQQNGNRFLSVFRCPCLGKKAVDVEVGAWSATKPAGRGEKLTWLHEVKHGKDLRMERLGFAFKEEGVLAFPPNLNSVAAKVTVGRESRREEKKVGERSSSLRTSLTTLTLANAAARGGGGGCCNDGNNDDDGLGSESSSDLFEIESLSVSSHPFFERDGDESVATGGYEPSEASIDWSVATGSAANLSVASESNGYTPNDIDGKKTSRSHRPGIFMGCVSRKAVSVAADSHRAMSVSGRHEQLGVERSASPITRCRTRSFEMIDSESDQEGQPEEPAAPTALSQIQARRTLYMH